MTSTIQLAHVAIRTPQSSANAHVRTEWRLVMLSHNLQKLHRHQIATALG